MGNSLPECIRIGIRSGYLPIIGWPKMASQNQKSGFPQSMKKSWFSVIFFKKNVQGSK